MFYKPDAFFDAQSMPKPIQEIYIQPPISKDADDVQYLLIT